MNNGNNKEAYDKALRTEKIFGHPQFNGNDFYENCSRKTVIRGNNISFDLVIMNIKYDNRSSILKHIISYTSTANSWLLIDALDILGARIEVRDFTFPHVPLNELVEGLDPLTHQKLFLYSNDDSSKVRLGSEDAYSEGMAWIETLKEVQDELNSDHTPVIHIKQVYQSNDTIAKLNDRDSHSIDSNINKVTA